MNLLPHIHSLSQALTNMGITHWVDFGTLLGAVREGNVIQGDCDFDIGFLDHGGALNSLFVSASTLRKETGFELRWYEGNAVRFFWPEGTKLDEGDRHAIDSSTAAGHLWVDLYPCWVVGRSVQHKIQKHNFKAFFIDGDLPTVKIGGYRFPMPHHAKHLLGHRYGPEWRTPMTRRQFHQVEDSLIRPFKKRYACYIQGVFDLFHHGHVNLLANANRLFETVMVGVDDEQNVARYKPPSVMTYGERVAVIEACKWVDRIVTTPPAIGSVAYIDRLGADYVVAGTEDSAFLEGFWSELILVDRLHTVSRTPGISTGEIINRIRSRPEPP